jgi:hypothetical protein
VRARPAGSVDEHVWTRSVAVFWAWMGIAFVVWQLFEDTTRGPRGVLTTLVEALFLFALPSVLVLRRTSRPQPRALPRRSAARAPTRVRVGAPEREEQAVERLLESDDNEEPAHRRQRGK